MMYSRVAKTLLKTIAWAGLGTLAFGALNQLAYAQDRFPTPVMTEDERGPISEAWGLGVGLSWDSMIPTSSAFSDNNNSGTGFRFQVPTNIALELSYSLSRSFEVAASFGYYQYSTRNLITAGNSTQIDKVSFKSLPIVKAIGRYRNRIGDGVFLEAELGGGFGFGSVKIESSDQSATSIDNSVRTLNFHGGAGVAFAWAQNYSLHLLAGYAYQSFGENRYTQTAFDISQAASYSGPFTSAMIRYFF